MVPAQSKKSLSTGNKCSCGSTPECALRRQSVARLVPVRICGYIRRDPPPRLNVPALGYKDKPCRPRPLSPTNRCSPRAPISQRSRGRQNINISAGFRLVCIGWTSLTSVDAIGFGKQQHYVHTPPRQDKRTRRRRRGEESTAKKDAKHKL